MPELPTQPQIKEQPVLPGAENHNSSKIEEQLTQLIDILSENDKTQDDIQTQLAENNKVCNDIVNYFNVLKDADEKIHKELNNNFDYTKYLQSEIEKNQATLQTKLLQQQLEKEQAKFSTAINDITQTVTTNLEIIKQTVDNLKTTHDIITEDMQIINKHVDEVFTSQSVALKEETKNYYTETIKECQKTTSIVRDKCIDFLQQVDKENKNIISKIPHVKDEFKLKDIAVIGSCILNCVILLIFIFK